MDRTERVAATCADEEEQPSFGYSSLTFNFIPPHRHAADKPDCPSCLAYRSRAQLGRWVGAAWGPAIDCIGTTAIIQMYRSMERSNFEHLYNLVDREASNRLTLQQLPDWELGNFVFDPCEGEDNEEA